MVVVAFLTLLASPPSATPAPASEPLRLRLPRPTEPPAKADPAWLDPSAKPISPAQLARVKPTLKLKDFFAILGPASSDPCVHCWQWRCTDGRTLLISAAEPKPDLRPFGFIITNRKAE